MSKQICDYCGSYMLQISSIIKWLSCACGFRKYMKEIITEKQFYKGRDEQYKNELTDEIKNNAKIILNRVNALLDELKIEKAEVSSGWRPESINSNTKGASKKSAHMVGMAIDIVDNNHELYNKILERSDLLKKYDLWMEDKESTPTWVHLDFKQRTDRPVRVFKP